MNQPDTCDTSRVFKDSLLFTDEEPFLRTVVGRGTFVNSGVIMHSWRNGRVARAWWRRRVDVVEVLWRKHGRMKESERHVDS